MFGSAPGEEAGRARQNVIFDGRIQKDLRKEDKGIASRYFQLLYGHAAIGPYLADVIKTVRSENAGGATAASDGRGINFSSCRAWDTQIKELWKSVGRAYEWKRPRAPTQAAFKDEWAAPVVLQFLRNTKVGRIVTLPPREEEGE